MTKPKSLNPEQLRIEQADAGLAAWRRWGPYLSERQWGTVREDYSPDGTAWEYLPHDHARSRAYRWGEDGIAGFSDDKARLCFSVALWNGRDRILKERLFGLANSEGNHGEDVKEIYYYLDATPTHSYMKMLYKYPQTEFPYEWLVQENRHRNNRQPEFELIDTGVFDEDRYFDVFVEYAKAAPDDILVRITVHNRGPDDAPCHVLPQIWFRNTWAWKVDGSPKPSLAAATTATSVTGFFFPFERFTPALALGILSLIVLVPALAPRYYSDLVGPWRRTYVITAMIAQYLNVFVLIVQSFQKIPSLRELAPTQSEPPFALAQLVTLALFIAYTTVAAIRFGLEPSTEKSAPFSSAIPHAREVVNVQDRN